MNLTPYQPFNIPATKETCITYRVILNRKEIDKVSFSKSYTMEKARQYLITEEGYSKDIIIIPV